MANSTLALLTQLKLKQPDIWGWSLGGSVAYALLAYHGGEAVQLMSFLLSLHTEPCVV
jgi:pimeloyl-ACP methyl ester carboxylesterase